MSEYIKLDVNGQVIYYKQYWYGHPDESDLYTRFYTYEGKKPEMKWSWSRFKKIPTGRKVDNYVHRFTLYVDVESSKYTKGQIRGKIEYQLELIRRGEEIKKGEII